MVERLITVTYYSAYYNLPALHSQKSSVFPQEKKRKNAAFSGAQECVISSKRAVPSTYS